jgi:hypothetical protein
MKDNKNVVFAIRSFIKNTQDQFEHNGYLLFPEEAKAMDFLELCENLNKKEKVCHYEKYTWVKVNDYVGDRVNQQKQFYVSSVEIYEMPKEENMEENKEEETA